MQYDLKEILVNNPHVFKVISGLAKHSTCIDNRYSALLVDNNIGRVISFGFTAPPILVSSIRDIEFKPKTLDDIIEEKYFEIELKGSIGNTTWKMSIKASYDNNNVNTKLIEDNSPKFSCYYSGECALSKELSKNHKSYLNCPSVHAEQMAIYIASRLLNKDIKDRFLILSRVNYNGDFEPRSNKGPCIECAYVLNKYNITVYWLGEDGKIYYSRQGVSTNTNFSQYKNSVIRLSKKNKISIILKYKMLKEVI